MNQVVGDNIHPQFSKFLSREAKEKLLGQKGKVLWLYGLSGSGKTTIANALERKLHREEKYTITLDGDNVRTGLNKDLGFSDTDRRENIRRIAEVAKLFAHNGVITLVSFITPKESLRELAKEIIGRDDFVDVYIKCSFEKCKERDVKGLYAKVEKGEIKKFTGKDSDFEEPKNPSAVFDTEEEELEVIVENIYREIS